MRATTAYFIHICAFASAKHKCYCMMLCITSTCAASKNDIFSFIKGVTTTTVKGSFLNLTVIALAVYAAGFSYSFCNK